MSQESFKPQDSQEEIRAKLEQTLASLYSEIQDKVKEYKESARKGVFYGYEPVEGEESGAAKKERAEKKINDLLDRAEKLKAKLDSGETLKESDLKKEVVPTPRDLEIFEDMRNGNFDNIHLLTTITPEISKLLNEWIIKNPNKQVNLWALESAEGLTLPEKIAGNLDLRSLTSAEGLTLPKYIVGYLRLSRLKSAEGLILPEKIGGYINLKALKSTKGLILPENIGGYLDLSSLSSAEGLTLPKYIGGSLGLSGLTSAEGLVLPGMVGNIFLSGLTSAKGLVLPGIVGDLVLNSLSSSEKDDLRKKYPKFKII